VIFSLRKMTDCDLILTLFSERYNDDTSFRRNIRFTFCGYEDCRERLCSLSAYQKSVIITPETIFSQQKIYLLLCLERYEPETRKLNIMITQFILCSWFTVKDLFLCSYSGSVIGVSNAAYLINSQLSSEYHLSVFYKNFSFVSSLLRKKNQLFKNSIKKRNFSKNYRI